MKEPKRYYCGNGEGMFEDNKNGEWVEYSEHKAIVEALTKQLRNLTKQLRKHAVVGRSEQLLAFFQWYCNYKNNIHEGSEEKIIKEWIEGE